MLTIPLYIEFCIKKSHVTRNSTIVILKKRYEDNHQEIIVVLVIIMRNHQFSLHFLKWLTFVLNDLLYSYRFCGCRSDMRLWLGKYSGDIWEVINLYCSIMSVPTVSCSESPHTWFWTSVSGINFTRYAINKACNSLGCLQLLYLLHFENFFLWCTKGEREKIFTEV